MRTRRTPNPAHQSAHVDSCWLARELGIQPDTARKLIRAGELQGLITPLRTGPGHKQITGITRSDAARLVAAWRQGEVCYARPKQAA